MRIKVMTFLRSIFILSSWLFATMAMAEEFNVKEAFRAPVPVPGPVIAYLSNELGGNKLAACRELKALDLFEAQLISLNASTKAYLVKPARMCLCGGDECPLWLFKAKSKVTKPIWHTSGASMVEVMDKKLNGYSKLKESDTAAEHGHEAVYGWDRNGYTEIYSNVWVWDAEKSCRVGKETTQLMDGTMVHHTKKCMQVDEKPPLTTP